MRTFRHQDIRPRWRPREHTGWRCRICPCSVLIYQNCVPYHQYYFVSIPGQAHDNKGPLAVQFLILLRTVTAYSSRTRMFICTSVPPSISLNFKLALKRLAVFRTDMKKVYSLFTPRTPDASLIFNRERGFLKVNWLCKCGIHHPSLVLDLLTSSSLSNVLEVLVDDAVGDRVATVCTIWVSYPLRQQISRSCNWNQNMSWEDHQLICD